MKRDLRLDITDADLEKMATALEEIGETFPDGETEPEERTGAPRLPNRA